MFTKLELEEELHEPVLHPQLQALMQALWCTPSPVWIEPTHVSVSGRGCNQEGKECFLESSSLDIHILHDIASGYSQQLRNSHFPCVNAAVGIFQIVHSVIAL